MIPLSEMRLQMIISDLSKILSIGYSSYESRKMIIEKVEKFIMTLRVHEQLI